MSEIIKGKILKAKDPKAKQKYGYFDKYGDIRCSVSLPSLLRVSTTIQQLQEAYRPAFKLKDKFDLIEVEVKTGGCTHNFQYAKTESYKRKCGRNNFEYYRAIYSICNRCSEISINENRCSAFSGDEYKLPEWAKIITNTIPGYDS